MAGYCITHNPSHQMMSLIWRHVISWWDAQGLQAQRGCCGRKSFYCSKHALLNDDNNDDEETFGEYVESTKQLKKIRRWEEMPKRRIPWKWQPRCFSPWYWWKFLWLIFLWLNRCSFRTHSSNSGAMAQLIRHPLSPYILSFTKWVKYPPLLSSILFLWSLFLCCIIILPWLHYCAYWGCMSWLISDSFLTHIILHAGRIFQQRHCNCIICLVVEIAWHVYKGQFSPWLGQFYISLELISCIHWIQSLLQSKYSLGTQPPDLECQKLSDFGHNLTSSLLTSSTSRSNRHLGKSISSLNFTY